MKLKRLNASQVEDIEIEAASVAELVEFIHDASTVDGQLRCLLGVQSAGIGLIETCRKFQRKLTPHGMLVTACDPPPKPEKFKL